MRAALWARRARLLGAAGLLSLLGACATPPAGAPIDVPPEPPPTPVREPLAPLRPLVRQANIPADAPRSQVPAVRYDLAVGRAEGDLPADGTGPDDVPPGEVYERGGASWYGIQFHQRRTANGERFDMGAFTAAHKTLPFGTRVCVRSLVNGKEVLVRVNDRGPYAAGRVIDLSRAAAEQIDMIGLGIKQVALTLIGTEGGRCNGEAIAGAGGTPAADADFNAEPPARQPVARATRRRAK